MPIIEVRHVAGALDRTQKAAIAAKLTEVMIQMEGGANTEGGRAFATVLFTPTAAEDWWVGGATDDTYVAAPGRFIVNVWIPEGYMNIVHKNQVHAWVAGAITVAMGTREPGRSILTVINEVIEGDWGNAGHPISLESIAGTVGQAQDGPRLTWSRDYFKAKARAMAAAGYPADTGGLLPSLTPAGDPARKVAGQ
ncbi:tautomerase family protein [Xanthobacter sediminis]|uniref:tautomerase family protein n=1 Tax=Xanthobacter sediminis TaxID=3119926 RepID=UPI00372C350E